jgi:hypothetical protein
MNRSLTIAALCLLATAVPAAAAADGDSRTDTPADIHFLSPEGKIQRGVRCATPVPTPHEQELVRGQVERWLAERGAVAGLATSIPVQFHVIYKTQGGTAGLVSQQQIDDQIDVLNDAFAGTGFSFFLAGVDFTNNRKWFNGCASSGTERKIKQDLTVDPAHNLNIYTCNPSGGLLGWAYFPWSAPENSYWHGVVALYSSLPGGSAAPYNLGDTVTHEVGHYLGLYHTFQDGCSSPGDEIDDTPFESTPAFGCPVGRNTCPQTGNDPIFNFMDYTDDACMDEFTTDQADRMTTMTGIYRPSL